MKGQGSTEYLVILAVVLVVALIVVGLLGQFAGFGQQSKMQQSKVYWSGAQPLAITDELIDTSQGKAFLVVKNQEADSLTLTKVEFANPTGNTWVDVTNLTVGDITFAPGQTQTVDLNITAVKSFCQQGYFNVKVRLTYNKGTANGLVEIGDVPLYGKCA